MTYKQIKINITKEQLKKALNGKPVQFKASQLGVGDSYLSLHPANVQKVEKSVMAGRGCCLNLSEGELLSTAEDMGGEGLFGDIWKGLKSGYKWTKKNVIDTPLYQEIVKPLVRGAVDIGETALTTALPSSKSFVRGIKDKISKETGAFGVKGVRKTKAQKKALLAGKGLYLS
jgi:hypothetical protein